MHAYATLADETTIAFSDVLDDGSVEVLIERPTDEGFDSARYSVPSLARLASSGFSATDLGELDSFVARHAPIISGLARDRGLAYT